MSQTACWANETDFDCAYVTFGYGSRYDSSCRYKKGWQLSLNGLKYILQYDYPLHVVHYHNWESLTNYFNGNWEGCQLNPLNMKFLVQDKNREWDELMLDDYSLDIQMNVSGLDIVHKNALEWFEECKKVAGSFWKNHSKDDFKHTEDIFKFDPEYEKIMKRIKEKDNRAFHCSLKPYHYPEVMSEYEHRIWVKKHNEEMYKLLREL
jgi:hypothetical protein